MTIHRWLRNDAAFQAAFNAWQAELRISTRARLSALCDTAVDTLQTVIEKQDGKLAMKLLQGMGMISPLTPGPENAAEIVARQDLERRQKEAKLKIAVSDLAMDEAMAHIGESLAKPPKDLRNLPAAELIKMLEEDERE